MNPLKVFLSYSTDDKQLAGKIKQQLAFWGIDVFLAHEDLVPSSEWEDEIVRNVESCDVFIPLLTGSFKLSDWTDQESGMAISHSRTVMPLNITRNPHGFLAKYQAFKFDHAALDQSCRDLVLKMKDKKELKSKVQDSFIQSFVTSGNFPDANTRSELLEDIGPYDQSQVNEIIRGSLENPQVYGAFTAQPKLKRLFSKNKEIIRDDLKKRFEEVFGERKPKPPATARDLISLINEGRLTYTYLARHIGDVEATLDKVGHETLANQIRAKMLEADQRFGKNHLQKNRWLHDELVKLA